MPAPVHPSALIRPYDGPKNLDEQMKLASLLADAKIGLPDNIRGDAGAILALIYRAIALDIPFMVAVDNLVFGRSGCAMRARLMQALVTVRAGHRLVPGECNEKSASVTLEYCDGRKPFTATWTIATAHAAGLVKANSPWVNYPANMLYWRAMAKAVALGCPEATLGMAVVEAGGLDEEPEEHELQTVTRPETIIVTDDGIQVADETITGYLEEVATKGDNGYPVAKPEATIATLRELWTRASKPNGDGPVPLLRFAWSNGKDNFTLEQTIAVLVEQVSNRDAKASAASPETEPARIATAPAGIGNLPCGCDAATVATTGEHQEACTK